MNVLFCEWLYICHIQQHVTQNHEIVSFINYQFSSISLKFYTRKYHENFVVDTLTFNLTYNQGLFETHTCDRKVWDGTQPTPIPGTNQVQYKLNWDDDDDDDDDYDNDYDDVDDDDDNGDDADGDDDDSVIVGPFRITFSLQFTKIEVLSGQCKPNTHKFMEVSDDIDQLSVAPASCSVYHTVCKQVNFTNMTYVLHIFILNQTIHSAYIFFTLARLVIHT